MVYSDNEYFDSLDLSYPTVIIKSSVLAFSIMNGTAAVWGTPFDKAFKRNNSYFSKYTVAEPTWVAWMVHKDSPLKVHFSCIFVDVATIGLILNLSVSGRFSEHHGVA